MVLPLPSPNCGSDRTSVFVAIALLLHPRTPKGGDLAGKLSPESWGLAGMLVAAVWSRGANRPARGATCTGSNNPGEPDSLPHSYVCLLQEIHLFGSCWGLINSYGFCDPVINSFSRNCLKTKQCIGCFSPSPSTLAMASKGTQQSIRTWFFLPVFLSVPAFLRIPYKARRKSVRNGVVSCVQLTFGWARGSSPRPDNKC